MPAARIEFTGSHSPETMDSSRFEQYARIAGIALLVVGCFLVIRPFLAAMLFAAVICLSTWPAYRWVKVRTGGRNTLAALLFALGMLLAIALPVALVSHSLITHSAQAIDVVRGLLDRGPPEAPSWVAAVPLVGGWVSDYWHDLVSSQEQIVALAKRIAEPAKGVLFAAGAAVGEGLLQILLAIFVAFFLYRDGDEIARMIQAGVVRLAGSEQGVSVLSTAQNAVKGVVYGLIGTAIAQAGVALVGFVIAGVPGALLLAALTFVLSLVPMGPMFVWVPAAIWLYAQGQPGWALFMALYGAFGISSVDNLVKPILMSRAGGLSVLLVVLGVFGGAIAFGFIGIFVGPVLLAVAWSLIKAWLAAHRLTEVA